MSIPTRAFTPVRNPVYVYNDDATWKKAMPQARNVLDHPPVRKGGVDPRLTSQGDISRAAGLTPIVPAATQSPWNVWGLYPA